MPVQTDGHLTTLTHPISGSKCVVHAFGATVLSFVSSDGRENLFVSKQAVMDGSQPIRGGIPVVFPVFGPSGSSMPQHGFARRNYWKVNNTIESDHAVGVEYVLDLKDATEGRGNEDSAWSVQKCEIDEIDCRLVYDIRLESGHDLITTLKIFNTGKSSFNFQALFHTYYKVDGQAAFDGTKTYIKGLGGYGITDKVSGDAEHVQSYDDPVVLEGETDKLFVHPDSHPVVHAEIGVGIANPLRLETAGQVDEQPSPISCVVWNPHKEKAAALSDFGDEEYQEMICIEPGLVGHQPLLLPGANARLSQTIITHHVPAVPVEEEAAPAEE